MKVETSLMEQPINQSVITLERSGWRNIKNFVKSQLLFDIHRQYLWTFLTDLQAEVSRFRCQIFHCFAYFLKIYLDYHRVLSFISYPLVTVLHLESFENNLVELDFSYLKKRVSTVKPSQEGEFFCTVTKYFFQDSCVFPYIKTFLKVSDPVFEKNPTRVNNLDGNS